jgi:hypothetical protein
MLQFRPPISRVALRCRSWNSRASRPLRYYRALAPRHRPPPLGRKSMRGTTTGLDRLCVHAALAELDVVLVAAPDRLARNYAH